jgi:hypothetical protein
VKRLQVTTWPLRVAIAATLAAGALVLAGGRRATHFDEMGTANAPGIERGTPQPVSYRQALVSELDRAVDLDPFQPERQRPGARYQLPQSGPPEPAQSAEPVSAPVELVGTVVVAGGRSFAMCQSGAGPQIVHIGEKFAGHTLKSVAQGSAVFVSPNGKAMTILVKKTGS